MGRRLRRFDRRRIVVRLRRRSVELSALTCRADAVRRADHLDLTAAGRHYLRVAGRNRVAVTKRVGIGERASDYGGLTVTALKREMSKLIGPREVVISM